jgi:AraC-like DNA-binding protein
MLTQIQQNYTQRLTLTTLARTLGRQSAYLGQQFRDEIGLTVHEYITRARIAYGSAQVRSGVKIEAVALDLGYRSKKNFYRQFKRRFGMTPEAYRHEHLGSPRGHSVAAKLRGAQTDPSNLSTPISRDDDRRPGSRTREAARQALLLAEQTTNRPIPATRIAMLVTDDSGCYVGANRTAVAMTRYSVEELSGMSVETIFPQVSDTRCRLQLFVPASSALPTNAVLRPKAAGLVPVYLTSIENLIRRALSVAL